MYKLKQPTKTKFLANTSKQGETIEAKMRRILNNKEPIKDVAPTLYTDRKDGVLPQYDIRADRMELAAEALDKVATHHHMKRSEQIGERTFDTMTEAQQAQFKKDFPNNKLSQPKNEGTA